MEVNFVAACTSLAKGTGSTQHLATSGSLKLQVHSLFIRGRTVARTASRRQSWTGYVLGFALGGFFDGILLHQILQWHHLLSAIDGGDIRFQVAADGYFHALMYGVAAVGLWLLWASRN